MLSNEVKEIINMLRSSKEQGEGRELTPEGVLQDRKRLDEMMDGRPTPEGIEVEFISEQEVSGELLHYDPSDPEKREGHILLFLHGGGFMFGSPMSRRQLCAGILKNAKMDGLTVKYGQWPEAKHPEGMMDCIRAYLWLLAKGYSPDKIHLFGESAGAMLTLTMLLYLKDQGEPLPKNACVFSPIYGQDVEIASHITREERDPMISWTNIVPYYREAELHHPYVSPGFGDYKGFPRLQIHVGSEEVLFDDSVEIAKRCREAGVDVSLRVWDGLFHVFPLFPCPETDAAIEEIAAFLISE